MGRLRASEWFCEAVAPQMDDSWVDMRAEQTHHGLTSQSSSTVRQARIL